MTFNLEKNDRLLDPVGWQILAELQADARISYSELGRRVGLTSPAVAERIRRMEETGIITGYRVSINPAAVGLPITVIIRLRSNDGGWTADRIAARVDLDFPEIIECHRVTGDDSFVIKAVVTTVIHLENLIDRLKVIGDLVTSLVLSSPVQARPIEPGMLAVMARRDGQGGDLVP